MCSWGWNALAERPAAARAPLQSSAPLGRGETEVWDESHRDMQIPKDRDGRPKQFAFVNFKHEESVPYGLRLLNGIKLYGRPMRIQFRSGTGDNFTRCPVVCLRLTLLLCFLCRYERVPDGMGALGYPSSLQRQAVMNSAARQQPQFGGKYGEQPGFAPPGYPHSFHGLPGSPGPRRLEGPRKARLGAHPYGPDGRHFGREGHEGEHHYRGREEHYEDRHRDGWSYEHRRDSYREAKWHSSRH
uniref:RNA binding motif protein 7 n=1 Tax=Zonotrichia albicollis TaxID=44394 RepID=A0A8D2N0S2_ZONAL